MGYDFSTSEATRYSLKPGYSDVGAPTSSTGNGDSSVQVSHRLDERNGFSLFLGNGYVASGTGQVRYESRLNLSWDHSLSEKCSFIFPRKVARVITSCKEAIVIILRKIAMVMTVNIFKLLQAAAINTQGRSALEPTCVTEQNEAIPMMRIPLAYPCRYPILQFN